MVDLAIRHQIQKAKGYITASTKPLGRAFWLDLLALADHKIELLSNPEIKLDSLSMVNRLTVFWH